MTLFDDEAQELHDLLATHEWVVDDEMSTGRVTCFSCGAQFRTVEVYPPAPKHRDGCRLAFWLARLNRFQV